MAFVGHPILAEIRKGTRLRPTQTVDKSRPMIHAEGESVPSLQPRGPPVVAPPPPPAPPCPPAAVARPPPPPPPPLAVPLQPPPPPFISNQPRPQAQPVVSSGPPGESQRQKLLAQIRGGVRLKHVQTADKSGLVLSEQEQNQQLLITSRSGTPNGSLDSQGKSPSPSMGTLSSPGASCSSVLSPSPPASGASLGWPSGSFSPSRSPPSPDQARPINSNKQPQTRHWPEVQTQAEKQAAQNRQKSDFHFDDQQQVEERQKEVAALSGSGTAQSKIAAFRQLQNRPSNGGPPVNSNGGGGFCTLPRVAKPNVPAGQGPKPAMAANGRPAAGKLQNGGRTTQTAQKQLTVPPPKQQQLANGQAKYQPAQPGGPQRSLISAIQTPPPAIPRPPPLPAPAVPVVVNQCRQPQFVARPTGQQQPSKQIQQQQKHSMAPPSPAVPVPAAFFRPYSARVGQPGGAHRQQFERIRGQFAETNGGNNGVGEQGAEAVWKEAARQRKEAATIPSQPPPLPNCPPPPLNGQAPANWDSLREQFKFAVDLDAGPEGKALIRIVRR